MPIAKPDLLRMQEEFIVLKTSRSETLNGDSKSWELEILQKKNDFENYLQMHPDCET